MTKSLIGSENVNVASATGWMRGFGAIAVICNVGGVASMCHCLSALVSRALVAASTMSEPACTSIST